MGGAQEASQGVRRVGKNPSVVKVSTMESGVRVSAFPW